MGSPSFEHLTCWLVGPAGSTFLKEARVKVEQLVPGVNVRSARSWSEVEILHVYDYVITDVQDDEDDVAPNLKRLDPKYVSYLLPLRRYQREDLFDIYELESYVGGVRITQPDCTDFQAAGSLTEPLREWCSVVQAASRHVRQSEILVSKAVETQVRDLELLIEALVADRTRLQADNDQLRLEVAQLEALVQGLRASASSAHQSGWVTLAVWVAAIGGVLSGIGGMAAVVQSTHADTASHQTYLECVQTNDDLRQLLDRIIEIEDIDEEPNGN